MINNDADDGDCYTADDDDEVDDEDGESAGDDDVGEE